jgi:hypothetical protein
MSDSPQPQEEACGCGSRTCLFFGHGAATAFSFAAVLALAAIVTGLAAAGSLALIVPLASVLALVCHFLNGDAWVGCFWSAGVLGGVGSGKEAGECCRCDDLFGAHDGFCLFCLCV